MDNISTKTQLEVITTNIIATKWDKLDIGLFSGRLGQSLYLFQYSLYSRKNEYRLLANEYLNEVIDTINISSPINYSDGLAGFGTLINYLIKNAFITIDSDDFLEDIDTLLYKRFSAGEFSNIGIPSGVSGLGKYFVSRVDSAINMPNSRKDMLNKNSEIICELVQLFDVPYHSYSDVLSAIEFLSAAYKCCSQRCLIEDYLNYAMDKMETMIYEDLHFGYFPGDLNMLKAALVLNRASEHTHISRYSQRGIEVLTAYEENYSKWLHNAKETCLNNGLLYSELYYQFCDKKFQKKSLEWLKMSKRAVPAILQSPAPLEMGIINGLSGLGLILISALNYERPKWLELFPSDIFVFRGQNERYELGY